jgi:hypothetical protein
VRVWWYVGELAIDVVEDASLEISTELETVPPHAPTAKTTKAIGSLSLARQ